MRKLGYLLLLFIAAFPASSFVAAQDARLTVPSAAEIFRQNTEALGGREAVKKIKSRVTRANAEIPAMGLKGTFETYSAAHNKSLTILNLVGYGEVFNGFDGSVAWVKDPAQGLRSKSGEELEQVKSTADFYSSIDREKKYPNAEVAGLTKIGDAEAWIVKVDANTTLFFDKRTGLLLKSERTTVRGGTKMSIAIIYEDYRDVDGVKHPFTVRQSMHGGELVLQTTEVKQNVEIADSKFSKPKG